MIPGHCKPWSASPMTMVDHAQPWSVWSFMLFYGCMTMNYKGSLLYSMVVHGHLTIIFALDVGGKLGQGGHT